MTLTFIQDSSVISSANYLDKVNIRPKFERNCSVGEGDMKQTRNHYMKYTKGHDYIRTGRKTSSHCLMMLYICTFMKKSLNVLMLYSIHETLRLNTDLEL